MPFPGAKTETEEPEQKRGPEITSKDRPFILSCSNGDIIIFQLTIKVTESQREKMIQRIFKLLPEGVNDVDVFVLDPGKRIHIHDPGMIDFIINDVLNPQKDKEDAKS